VTSIRYVTVQLTPDSIAEGFYTYDGETVTMVMRDGSPVELDDVVTSEAAHPSRAAYTAQRLTRAIRKALLADAPPPGFQKSRLEYRKEGIA
jgi:hypothetical protein